MVINISNTGDKKYKYVNMLILGESGVGKTRFLGTVPEDQIIIINVISESGMLTLKDKNITTIDVDNCEDMLDAINWIKENGSKYSYIAVDSLSQWQKNLDDQISDGGNKFEKWKKIKDYTKEVVDELKRLPFHVVCTCELAKDKDETQGSYEFIPALLGSSKHELTYWFDEVYFFTKLQTKIGEPIRYTCLTSAATKYPCKSRANMPELIENPNLAEITEKMFGKIDKEEQKVELKTVVEKEKNNAKLREDAIAEIRAIANTKKFDVKKFHKEFSTDGNIETIKDSLIESAIEWLKSQKDKEVG